MEGRRPSHARSPPKRKEEAVMRSRIPTRIPTAPVVAVLFVLLLSACRAPSSASREAALADRLEKLPTLPADIAATLDPKTNATKTSAYPLPEPVKLPGTLQAPCCSIKDEKTLKVKVPLTKCGFLTDFIVADLPELVLARDLGGGGAPVTPTGPAGEPGSAGNVKVYKLDTVNRANVWQTKLCMTSEGPWDATFIEERHCNNFAPQDTLIVSGWGGLVLFHWNGGPANHPAEVS